MKLHTDTQWFRSSDGAHLLAGSPLTSFTVTDAGAEVLNAIETGADLPPRHEQLTQRLLATGAVHPETNSDVPLNNITVVIPAYITNETEDERLRNLVATLHGVDIIVVDDASPLPVTRLPVRLISHQENRGPAAARNSGLHEATTSIVAFIDADARATTEDLQRLASVLHTPKVVLAAPRITTRSNGSRIDEYEALRSPLNLGAQDAVVRPLSRVSYVPSTVLVADADALRTLGGFDESLRYGEDVDLVWRVVESGSLVRYVASIECEHESRASWLQFLRQRWHYGSSAAGLDRKHPYTASPLRAHALLLLLAVTVLSGYLYAALFFMVPVCAFFVLTLRSTKVSVRSRITIAWTGFVSTLRLLALVVRRAWWPLFIICSFFSVRVTAMYTFAVFTPLMFGILREKPRFVFSYVGLRLLDDLAYGAGVWAGVLKRRSVRCLLPVITFRRTSPRK